jgi:hypothetical protein
MRKAKRSIQRRLPDSVADLPTSVQKSYFMLSDAERAVLNTALEKYQPGQSEPIFVGGNKVFKPALRLMTSYRLAIDEIKDSEAIMIYTRWVDAVQLKRGENEEVYLTFSPSLRVNILVRLLSPALCTRRFTPIHRQKFSKKLAGPVSTVTIISTPGTPNSSRIITEAATNNRSMRCWSMPSRWRKAFSNTLRQPSRKVPTNS